jgi:hypothetical protein
MSVESMAVGSTVSVVHGTDASIEFETWAVRGTVESSKLGDWAVRGTVEEVESTGKADEVGGATGNVLETLNAWNCASKVAYCCA